MPAAHPDAPAFISQQVTAARRFYLHPGPRRRTPLAVVCGGWEACADNYAIDRKSFPYLSVEFVAAGEGEALLAGRTVRLKPGTVFAYGPGCAHRMRTASHPRLLKYFVDFSGSAARRLLRGCGLSPGAAIEVAAISDVRAAFDALISLGLEHDRRTERTCALQLEILLHVLARSQRSGSPAGRRARATFERVRDHIDRHFLGLATVEDIARACHVDASHLSRLLRRFQAESPLRYLQRRRMQWAVDRLRSSGLLIRQVADELGMDAFQFSRTFKRVHGLSPSDFLRARG